MIHMPINKFAHHKEVMLIKVKSNQSNKIVVTIFSSIEIFEKLNMYLKL